MECFALAIFKDISTQIFISVIGLNKEKLASEKAEKYR